MRCGGRSSETLRNRRQPFLGALGFLEDFAELHGATTFAKAFVSSFHEGVNLEGLSGGDRRCEGLEKLHDLTDERGVVATGLLFDDLVFAEDGHLVVGGPGMHGVKGAEAAIGPFGGDDGGLVRRDGGHTGASVPQDGEQGFGGMDAVEEQAGVLGHLRGRAIRQGSADALDLGGRYFHDAGIPAHGGGAENRHLGGFGLFEDRDGFLEGGGDWLVEEDGLASFEHRLDLLQVGAAIEAEDHDRIDGGGEFIDRADDAHAILVTHGGGEALHAIFRHGKVGTEGG